MKAIRVHAYGDPEVMGLEHVAEPEPGPGQVLVRVYAVGVNPVETYIRAGIYPQGAPLPYTPGTDAAGVVEAVGTGVTRVELGDRVYTSHSESGTYAEKTLCQESQVHPLPEGVSFEQGAGVNVPYSAAYRALFQRARAEAGEVVLVHGASGGVGVAAVQLGAAFGLTVIGTAGTEEGRTLTTVQGAQHVLDHHDPDHYRQALALTEERGVDIILELLANRNLGDDLKILANGGRVVVIGSRGTVTLDPRDTIAKETSILGMYIWNASEKETASIHAALGAGGQRHPQAHHRQENAPERSSSGAPRGHRSQGLWQDRADSLSKQTAIIAIAKRASCKIHKNCPVVRPFGSWNDANK